MSDPTDFVQLGNTLATMPEEMAGPRELERPPRKKAASRSTQGAVWRSTQDGQGDRGLQQSCQQAVRGEEHEWLPILQQDLQVQKALPFP